MIDAHHGWNKSYKPQFIGFVTLLILTVAAYRVVTFYELTDHLLTVTISILSVTQALIQFFFFLHLGLESKPHWGMITFLFMAMVVIIVVGGSLWIIYNLNYNMMTMETHH